MRVLTILLTLLLAMLLASAAGATRPDWTSSPGAGSNLSVQNGAVKLEPKANQPVEWAFLDVTSANTTNPYPVVIRNCASTTIFWSSSEATDNFVGTPYLKWCLSEDCGTHKGGKILVDLNGDGSHDDKPMKTDDGSDNDADGTAEQRAVIYGAEAYSVEVDFNTDGTLPAGGETGRLGIRCSLYR